MLTIDLPKSLAPSLASNGTDIRTAMQWQDAGGGRRQGKRAAKAYAANGGGRAVMLWKSGNVTVYTNGDRDGNHELIRIRFAD